MLRLAAFASGCSLGLPRWLQAQPSASGLLAGQALHRPGPYAVRSRDAQLDDARSGRVIGLRLHEPANAGRPAHGPSILITPDLLGRRRDGEAWARHWASWGLRVTHLQHLDGLASAASELDAPINPQGLPQTTLAEASAPMALLARLHDIHAVAQAIGDGDGQVTRQNGRRSPAPGHADTVKPWILVGLGYGACPSLALAGMRLASAPTTVLRDSGLRAALLVEPTAPRWALPADRHGRAVASPMPTEPFSSIRIPTLLLGTQDIHGQRRAASATALQTLDPRWLSEAGEQHRHLLLTDLDADQLLRPGAEPKGLSAQGQASWLHALQRSTEFLLGLSA